MNILDVNNCPYSRKHGTYGGASGLKDGQEFLQTLSEIEIRTVYRTCLCKAAGKY
jgi:hypothetical protein